MENSTSRYSASTRTASALNVIAGFWLIISPFFLAFTGVQAALWDSVVVGAAVLVLAWLRAANPEQNVGLSWLNLVLGIWAIFSPFALGFWHFLTPTWNDVVLGAIVTILAIWSVITTPAPRRLARQ